MCTLYRTWSLLLIYIYTCRTHSALDPISFFFFLDFVSSFCSSYFCAGFSLYPLPTHGYVIRLHPRRKSHTVTLARGRQVTTPDRRCLFFVRQEHVHFAARPRKTKHIKSEVFFFSSHYKKETPSSFLTSLKRS